MTSTKTNMMSRKAILITGGELFNKGAQSMVLTTVNELRARCENVDIFLLSGPDCRRDTAELNQFAFEILPWDFRMKLRGFSILRLVLKNRHFDDELECNMWRIIRKADLVIDVSGFRLSSQFSPVRIVDYLINLHFFKRHQTPVVLFPQSFGPFNFSKPLSFFLVPLIRHYLKYPKKIFAREDDGAVALNELGIAHQVERSLDTVLQAGDHSFSRAFHNRTASELPDIPDGAVALVPNQKTMLHSGSIDMLDLYSQLIRRTIEMGRSVFLLRHSFEDVSIIDALKRRFADEGKVIALLGDYDAVDLQSLLSQFDFVIASRYHAVVHSYKARVPCLVLGWALKYPALMREFEQDELYFDIRQPLDTSRLEQRLFELNRSRSDYSERIANKLESTMEKDIFQQAVRFVS
jgi:colanic acid/amylovoran biosynthesis protein